LTSVHPKNEEAPKMADQYENPMGLMGFEFIEFASPTPGTLEPIFQIMGFSKVATHRSKNVDLYRQGEINLILNNEPNSIASYFAPSTAHRCAAWRSV